MRLDHIAYRVKDRRAGAKIFCDLFQYTIAEEFNISFEDGSTTECLSLTPPEANNQIKNVLDIPWFINTPGVNEPLQFHMAPEIFISDGAPGSIVGEWVKNSSQGEGGIHHMAYQVDTIDEIVEDWRANGVEFLTDEIIDCPEDDLRQIFTKPIACMGNIIIELIERGDKGFCKNSVKDLMESTKGL